MLKVLVEGCEPTKGTKHSACIDLYASEDVTIGAGETKLIGLGVAIDEDEIKRVATRYAVATMPLDIPNVIYEEYIQNHSENFIQTHYIQLALRSSVGKRGLVIPNGVGIIDMDYIDEIKLLIHYPIELIGESKNVASTRKFHIKKGDKIAQATIVEHKVYLFGIDTENKRTGGFGSSGG